MANSGPGYQQHPEHTVKTAPAKEHVQVSFNGEVIADSQNALRLEEAKYPAVFYVPRADVKMDKLSKTAHRTHCPFKGDASYFTVASGGKTAENAVWSYETPYDEVTSIKEHLAFYPNRVDIRVV